jgi:hypothetical protein
VCGLRFRAVARGGFKLRTTNVKFFIKIYANTLNGPGRKTVRNVKVRGSFCRLGYKTDRKYSITIKMLNNLLIILAFNILIEQHGYPINQFHLPTLFLCPRPESGGTLDGTLKTPTVNTQQ